MSQTTTSETSPATKAVDQYFEAWNERAPEARLKAIQAAFTVDLVYSDPKADVKGPQAKSDMIGAVQAQILNQHSSFSFVRTTRIDEHHGWMRFNWALKDPDGKIALSASTSGRSMAMAFCGRLSASSVKVLRIPDEHRLLARLRVAAPRRHSGRATPRPLTAVSPVVRAPSPTLSTAHGHFH